MKTQIMPIGVPFTIRDRGGKEIRLTRISDTEVTITMPLYRNQWLEALLPDMRNTVQIQRCRQGLRVESRAKLRVEQQQRPAALRPMLPPRV